MLVTLTNTNKDEYVQHLTTCKSDPDFPVEWFLVQNEPGDQPDAAIRLPHLPLTEGVLCPSLVAGL